MTKSQVNCYVCSKSFSKGNKHINENLKFGYSFFCSSKCQFTFKTKQIKLTCENVGCNNKFKRSRCDISPHNFCSQSCFAIFNNAIKAAGFKPNPVLFADKCIAKDGHVCDSIAEMVIDNYLYEKNIQHERNVFYPGGIYTADFKISARWIEYFGLAGEHRRYDELRLIKQQLAAKYKLNLLEIYPKDLYPKNKLESILGY